MIINRFPRRVIEPLARLCLCAGLLSLSLGASQAEPVVPEPEKARSRLQDFTNHATELALRAMSMLGVRYVYGGSTPEGGLDCSGLVRYVFKEAWGANLPRTAEEISHFGQHIDSNDLQIGDLVFYNTLRRGFSHVGIYLGNNKFIHSPASGGAVRIDDMNSGYWKKRFDGARRINDPEQK